MRIACAALVLLALTGCSKPAPEAADASVSAEAPPPVSDDWPGKYEGDLMVRVSGTPGAHKVVLVAATADGCTGDIGLAGGETAKDISPDALGLTLQPDETTTCTVTIKKDGDRLTVSESGICTTYHGLSCSFNGSAVRLK
ncbi:MAG: hypothetical protein QM647_05450 [Asticcacaulis sp.]|uniref:hypothetical protein n=1 Tax=Asticcacaulis sp. TaxID=1872648 RepID=UPI0039E5D607